MIKHVRTGLQTRPDFQSWDRSGGTALESRPHMFNSGSRLSFGCGPAALGNSRRFYFSVCPAIARWVAQGRSNNTSIDKISRIVAERISASGN